MGLPVWLWLNHLISFARILRKVRICHWMSNEIQWESEPNFLRLLWKFQPPCLHFLSVKWGYHFLSYTLCLVYVDTTLFRVRASLIICLFNASHNQALISVGTFRCYCNRDKRKDTFEILLPHPFQALEPMQSLSAVLKLSPLCGTFPSIPYEFPCRNLTEN